MNHDGRTSLISLRVHIYIYMLKLNISGLFVIIEHYYCTNDRSSYLDKKNVYLFSRESKAECIAKINWRVSSIVRMY
jgi:hypothetical protein